MGDRMNSNSIVARTEGLLAVDMDGTKVMLNLDTGKYYALDNIGSRIWELIEQPQPITGLVETMMAEYAVTQQQCQDDLIVFLQKLQVQGLIVVS